MQSTLACSPSSSVSPDREGRTAVQVDKKTESNNSLCYKI